MRLNQFIYEIGFDYSNPTKCECYGDYCIKRKVNIIDFFTQKHIPLFVCNGLIRLLVENVKEIHYGYESSHIDNVRMFFEKISVEHHKIKYNMDNLFDYEFQKTDPKSLDKIFIKNIILERPFLCKEISLKNCIYVFNENEEAITSMIIRNIIFSELNKFSKSIIGVKKYSSLESKVRKSLNKFKQCYIKEESNVLLLDALLELFELEQKKIYRI